MHTMELDIAPHLEKLLYENDNLVIPGFGAFTSKPTNATIDYLGETISPPSKVLSFDETVQSDDGILVQHLTEYLQMPQDEARGVVEAFVEKMRGVLDNREIVTLPGIGRLYKNYARKVQFLPETTNFRADAYGLPGLSSAARHISNAPKAAEVSLGTTPTEPAATPTSPSNPEKSNPQPAATPTESYQLNTSAPRRLGANTWMILGALMLLGAGGLGYWLMQKKRASVDAGSKTEQVAGTTTTAITPMEAASAAIERDEQQKAKSENTAPVASPKDDMPDAVEEVTAKQIAAAAAAKAEPKTEKPVEKTKDTKPTATDGRRCVLVLGAFADKENVDKLIEKLKASGYDTYHRRDENNRHQVGVEFMYKDIREVQKNMEDLQKLTGLNSIWIKKR
jgi:cell division septation protein DedD